MAHRCAPSGGCDPDPDTGRLCCVGVLEAATWAPTGGNVQPWRIVVVKGSRSQGARSAKLYNERWIAYSKQYRGAISRRPLRRKCAARAPERTLAAGDYLGAHFGETPVVAIFCFNPKNYGDYGLETGNASRWSAEASVYTAIEKLAARMSRRRTRMRTDDAAMRMRNRKCASCWRFPDPWYTAAVIPIGLSSRPAVTAR